MALRGMSQANIDLGVFQETKCTDGIYTRESAGYRVVATDAPSRHRGRVALFFSGKRPWGRERRTWSMVREGRVIRSRTDYLLGTDRSLFRNVAVQDPRHNSNHYMVVGHLRSDMAWEHARYIKGRQKIPLKPPTEPTREDELFGYLRRAVPKPHGREKHRNAWISEEMSRLADPMFASV